MGVFWEELFFLVDLASHAVFFLFVEPFFSLALIFDLASHEFLGGALFSLALCHLVLWFVAWSPLLASSPQTNRNRRLGIT